MKGPNPPGSGKDIAEQQGRHREDYIALEQIRFPGMITFEKDIEETAFQLPPLTVQPIVENAIKL